MTRPFEEARRFRFKYERSLDPRRGRPVHDDHRLTGGHQGACAVRAIDVVTRLVVVIVLCSSGTVVQVVGWRQAGIRLRSGMGLLIERSATLYHATDEGAAGMPVLELLRRTEAWPRRWPADYRWTYACEVGDLRFTDGRCVTTMAFQARF